MQNSWINDAKMSRNCEFNYAKGTRNLWIQLCWGHPEPNSIMPSPQELRNAAKDTQNIRFLLCQGHTECLSSIVPKLLELPSSIWKHYAKMQRITEIMCARHIQNSWLQLYKETPEYLKSVMQICPAHVRIQSCLNRPENLIPMPRTPRMSDFNYVKASRDSEINYAKTSRITEFNYATWPDASCRRPHVFC